MISILNGWSASRVARLVARDLLAHERLVRLHDLPHPPVDLREVRLVDRLGEVEVVVEAVLDGRADRVLRARVQIAHRLGHHVRGGVTQHVQTVVGRVRRPARRSASAVGHERQVAELAVHARRQRALGQRGAHRLPFGELDGAAVGQGQGRHGRHDIGALTAPDAAGLTRRRSTPARSASPPAAPARSPPRTPASAGEHHVEHQLADRDRELRDALGREGAAAATTRRRRRSRCRAARRGWR